MGTAAGGSAGPETVGSAMAILIVVSPDIALDYWRVGAGSGCYGSSAVQSIPLTINHRATPVDVDEAARVCKGMPMLHRTIDNSIN